MGFEFKGMGDEVKPAVTTTTLSVNGATTNTVIGYPTNATITELVGEHAMATIVEENLTQPIFTEGEEEKLAIQFLEETGLYTKFLLYCGIQEQLKSLKDSLVTPTE